MSVIVLLLLLLLLLYTFSFQDLFLLYSFFFHLVVGLQAAYIHTPFPGTSIAAHLIWFSQSRFDDAPSSTTSIVN
jgi:hypothetical protein